MSKFTQSIEISGGWNKTDPDPKKNYGIGGCRIFFVLRGPKGAVSFSVFTDWYPMEVQKKMMADHNPGKEIAVTRETIGVQPIAASIDYHSPEPMHPWQIDEDSKSYQGQPCEFLKGVPCYHDGSSLEAEIVRDAMLVGGDKVVWKHMRRYYREVFESGKSPDGFGETLEQLSDFFKGVSDGAKEKSNN